MKVLMKTKSSPNALISQMTQSLVYSILAGVLTLGLGMSTVAAAATEGGHPLPSASAALCQEVRVAVEEAPGFVGFKALGGMEPGCESLDIQTLYDQLYAGVDDALSSPKLADSAAGKIYFKVLKSVHDELMNDILAILRS